MCGDSIRMPTLDWIGKKAVLNHHNEVPFHLLQDVPGLSVGDPGSGNLLVEADNLLGLKALLPYYAGQVKCIVIDPPYNTGNENWVYNDNVNSPEIRAWLGKVVGAELEDLSRHDKWLCMMYPRLALLKDFLTDDGFIMVHIDDAEAASLRLLMNDIFGPNNFLAQLVWQKGKKGDSKFFSVSHEYILVYARSKQHLVDTDVRLRRRKPGVDEVISKYTELRTKHHSDHDAVRKDIMAWYRSLPAGNPAKAHKHYNWSDDRGLYFPDNFHGPDDGRKSRPRYDILHPVTHKPCRLPSTGWRWEEARTKAALSDSPPRIHFGPDETTIPCRKSYLLEVDSEPFPSVFYKDGRAATLEVERLVGKGKFDFPKDAEVLADFIDMLCDEGDTVMDSFAGSATTGHAARIVADRGKFVRWVLVEMVSSICRGVAQPRLKAARCSFRYCRLGARCFDEQGHINPEVRFADLARHVYFTETGQPLPRERVPNTPKIGVTLGGTGLYLLYNGILKDRSVDGGNVLTWPVLESLPRHDGPRIIYGTACRISQARRTRENVVFKQIPYGIRTL